VLAFVQCFRTPLQDWNLQKRAGACHWVLLYILFSFTDKFVITDQYYTNHARVSPPANMICTTWDQEYWWVARRSIIRSKGPRDHAFMGDADRLRAWDLDSISVLAKQESLPQSVASEGPKWTCCSSFSADPPLTYIFSNSPALGRWIGAAKWYILAHAC
jgi:hypothetical protein